MSSNEPELIVLLKKLRYDLTDMQGKVSEALRMAGALALPDRVEHVCDVCKLKFPGPRSMETHLHYSHGWPVPQHILDAESRADINERSAP